MPQAATTIAFPVATPQENSLSSPLIGRRLLQLERQITDHYKALRQKQHPSYRPKKDDASFMKAAELCHQHGADPYEFIDAQFALNEFGTYPPPNHLVAEAAVERWRRYRSRVDDVSTLAYPGKTDQVVHSARVEGIWSCQNLYVSLLRKRCGLSEADIFLGEGSPLRAWFRLLCCPEPLLPQVDARYGAVGRQQLRGDEPLRRYLEHLETTTSTTSTPNLNPNAHGTIRPLRQILSDGAPGSPAAHTRIIPFPG